MDNFSISPDDCLVLRAFKMSSSLREAAKLLNCDPAGLQRKTQRISEDYGLLQKINGRWGLTDSGIRLVGWLEESIATQKKIIEGQSTLRIASTMWLTEQFLIPHLHLLDQKNQIQISTPENFENHLISGSSDFVIVCHPPEDPAIAHKQLFTEEWVVIAPAIWKARGQKITIATLLKKPFIRHEQMNPDIFSLNDLSAQTILSVDSLISVRAAVLHNLGWSIIPKILVHDLLKDKKIMIIDHPIEMDRKVCLWWLRRRSDSKKLSVSIINFLQLAHRKL